MPPASILVAEDQTDIRELLVMNLRSAGYDVSAVGDGPAALASQAEHASDLLVLDLMMPGLDGLEVTKALRARGRSTPILMLTAKSTELDRVLGLELGADDYLTKPFSMLELAARVKGVFRRAEQVAALKAAAAAAPPAAVIELEGLAIDVERHEARVGGRAVELTAKEFELLVYFARSPGRVFTRAQLLDQVWGYSHSGYEHTVNSHINRLRNKIERDPANPDFIQTVWGVGYKFAERRG
jgi:DNA-binding response OmpR family regulator